MGALKAEIDAYFQSHKIPELLNHLSETVFFFKPNDPIEFMAETVLGMKMAADAGNEIPSLYTEESFRAYFRMLDPIGVGMVSWAQLRSALQVLGFKDISVPELKEKPVFEDAFVKIGMQCVNGRLKIEVEDERDSSGVEMHKCFSESKLIDRRSSMLGGSIVERLSKSVSVAKTISAVDDSIHVIEEPSKTASRSDEMVPYRTEYARDETESKSKFGGGSRTSDIEAESSTLKSTLRPGLKVRFTDSGPTRKFFRIWRGKTQELEDSTN